MKTHLSFPRLIAITIFGFALTMVSNTLEPAVLNHKVLQLVPERAATALGFTTFAGLIVASLVQPIVGVFSDRTRSPWGRRLPYFVIGTLGVIACLYLIALAPVWGMVVVGILIIQVFSNVVQGPWQALIPDQVPEHQRGRAASMKGFFEIVAALAGGYAAGSIVAQYVKWGEVAVVVAVSVPVVIYLIALVVTAIGAREVPEAADNAPQRTIGEALAKTFYVDFRSYPAFGWWFANRLLFWAGLLMLRTFLLLFVVSVVGLSEAQAQRYVAQLNIVLGVALVLVMIPSGWLSDRFGRKPLVVASGLLAGVGTALILLSGSNLTAITAAGAVVGIGTGIFISANWALVTDIVPDDEAARYLGMANIATAGGSGLGRLLGALLIDPLNAATQTTSVGYLVIYGIATAFFLASALIITQLPALRRTAA